MTEISETQLEKELEELEMSFMAYELYKSMRRDGEITFERAKELWGKQKK